MWPKFLSLVFLADLKIDDSTYSAGFFICWLCHYVLSSLPLPFVMRLFQIVAETVKCKRYSLAAPILPFCISFGEICAIHGEVKRTYRPWSVMFGWLGCIFLRYMEVYAKDLLLPFLYATYVDDFTGELSDPFQTFLVSGAGLCSTLSI